VAVQARQEESGSPDLTGRRLNYTRLNYLRLNFHFIFPWNGLSSSFERPRCISSWMFGYDSHLDKTFYSWSSLVEKRILTHQP
jgi:hypothetical protein